MALTLSRPRVLATFQEQESRPSLRLIRTEEPLSAPPHKRAKWILASGAVAFLLWQALAIGLKPSYAVVDPLYVQKEELWRTERLFRPTPPVLAFGSSRLLFGLEAGQLEEPRVFNFGIAAAGPMTHALYFHRLLRAGCEPRQVLIEVLPAFFAGQRPVPMETRWLTPDRLRDVWEQQLLRDFGYEVGDPPSLAWHAGLVPMYAYRQGIIRRLLPDCLPMAMRLDGGLRPEPTGEIIHLREFVGDDEHSKGLKYAHKQYGEYLANFRVGGPGCVALRHMLTLCRTLGIEARLILMPEGSQFRAWYSDEANKQLSGFLRELQQKFGVDTIDARTWVPDTGFSDGHHLLRPGASIFTQKLAQVLRDEVPHE